MDASTLKDCLEEEMLYLPSTLTLSVKIDLQQVYVHPRMPFPGCQVPYAPTCHVFYQLCRIKENVNKSKVFRESYIYLQIPLSTKPILYIPRLVLITVLKAVQKSFNFVQELKKLLPGKMN